MEKIKILMFSVLAILVSSCNRKVENSPNKEIELIINEYKCDSIIYELPEGTTKIILAMLENKIVSHCNISTTENDQYTFSFPYDDKTYYMERDSVLLHKTNTFLRLNNKCFPVISIYDYLFSDLPQKGSAINDFNYCFIKVNAQGIIEDAFAY